MKQLLKIVFGGCLSLIIANVFIMVCVVGCLGTLVSGDQSKSITEGSVLHINLNSTITDRAQGDSFRDMITSGESSSENLEEILEALKIAAANEDIVGVYLEGGNDDADFATRQEIREALVAFKKSGKFIVSYADQYSQGSYYIASVADKVMLNPSGLVDWHGIASQPIFYKDLLDKLGVKVQVFKVGTYKSAVEPFILTGMSDANREQVNSFISDIWKKVVADVAKSRKISEKALNDFADNYVTLKSSNYYVEQHLVDTLCYIDNVRTQLRTLANTDEICLVTPHDVVKNASVSTSDEHVAVYYAVGDIIDQDSRNGIPSTGDQIVGSKVVKDFDALMNDDDVKAVVVRVNSGGGSAYASEQMWHAMQLLKSKKPVVVSMGGMAASGGYYLSCGANKIYADATTLTGSIGIFGMIPDASGLLTDKLGLHFDVVKTNESSDFGSFGRGFNAAESVAMQNYIESGYKLFLKRVADGRGLSVKAVDAIAQGRVWTGNQALKIGLVDKLGGLDEAIKCAAKLAKLKDYDVVSYPEPKAMFESLMDNSNPDDYLERKAQSLLGDNYKALSIINSLQGGNYLQARISFLPNLK